MTLAYPNPGSVGPNTPSNPSSSAGLANNQAAEPPIGTNLSNSTSTGLKTQGWYLAAAIGVSIALGNTPVGPLCFGVLTVALIYQTSLLLQHK